MSASLWNPTISHEISGLVLGLGAAAGIVFAVIAGSRRRMHAPRQVYLSERSFIEHLRASGFDPLVAAITYRYLRSIQEVRFPILPGDTLDWDLGLDEEQVGKSLLELTSSLGRQVARSVQFPVTVEDLVRAVQSSPKLGEVAAA